MTTVSDSAGGSGALGTTEVGGLPFVEFPASGAFTRNAGLFKPMGSDAGNPIACVDLGWGDVDVSVNVSPGGGDAVYFRVLDAGNWWRARVYTRTTSSTSTVWDGTYDVGPWVSQGDACYAPGDDAYSVGTHFYNYVGSFPTKRVETSSTTCIVGGDLNGGHKGLVYTRSVTKHMVTTTSTSTTRQVVVDRCLNGTVTTQATYSATPSLLRVVAQGSSIQTYAGTTLLGTVTSADLKGATRHGFGRATSSNTGTALDNLAITTLGDPPNAPQLVSPASGAVLNDASTNRLQWAFNAASTGDTQSKAQVSYRPVGASTWTTLDVTGPRQYVDLPPATLTPGDYEWRVTTWGATGLAGPQSASGFFTAADPPDAPIITYPASGGTVDQSDRIDWTTADQDAFQVQRVADNAGTMADPSDPANVYFDTGEVTATSRSRSLTFETNGRPEWLRVRVKDGGLWSDWSSVPVDVSYTPPIPPVVLFMQPIPARGSLNIGVLNPDPVDGEPEVIANDIYVSSDVDPEERLAKGLGVSPTWEYMVPAKGRDYRVRVVAYGANGTTSSSLISDGVQAAINDGAWT